ncbi:recombinase family protein [Thalassospira lohafexi]|uniref:Resolvase n=1 Tax=Thalassospira lohafexi TaxID=744227 RepID=A0A2N3LAQ1_9PROT|nr:recombinase family protein [Thalassospira lohafexi]PKR59933.1 resolvase [Thalassospira lohafexi]
MHTFAYARVSTTAQTTENQIKEIEDRGYTPDTIYQDVISGKVPTAKRQEFSKLIDTVQRMKGEKRLIVSKLDRLGRDAADILQTVRALEDLGCKVLVLQLGELDLTSTAGKLVLSTLSAVAEMERDILIERTQAGLSRARSQGKTLGRPNVTDEQTRQNIRHLLTDGKSVSAIARQHGISRQTVMRIRDDLKD